MGCSAACFRVEEGEVCFLRKSLSFAAAWRSACAFRRGPSGSFLSVLSLTNASSLTLLTPSTRRCSHLIATAFSSSIRVLLLYISLDKKENDSRKQRDPWSSWIPCFHPSIPLFPGETIKPIYGFKWCAHMHGEQDSSKINKVLETQPCSRFHALLLTEDRGLVL